MPNLFEEQGHSWWDEAGPFAPLHALNHVRLDFMRAYLPEKPGFTVLDVGCGGGLVCEPLARLGGRVSGIDASASAIETAKAHAEKMNLNIDYRVESNPPEGIEYDVVCALEVLEHVDDPKFFVRTLISCVKPGGVLFVSTLNRTWCSWLKAIVGAEYVLGWVPRGTHQWQAFLSPGEVADMLRPQRWHALKGISYAWGNWALSDKRDTNYIGCVYRDV